MGNYQRNKYLCWTILICSESGNGNFNSPIILGMGRGGGRGHRACFSADPISVFVTDWVLFACTHLHTHSNCTGLALSLGWGGLKDTAAAKDDHAPRATTSFIQEGGYVVLLHYLKTQQENILYCKAGCKSGKTLISFYQPVDKVQECEGSGTYSDLRFK